MSAYPWSIPTNYIKGTIPLQTQEFMKDFSQSFLVFCLGFIVSTILALIAYGLSLGVVQLMYTHDEPSPNSIDACSTISKSAYDNTTFQMSTNPGTTNFRRNSTTIVSTTMTLVTGSPSTTASPVTPRKKCEKRIVLYHDLSEISNITEEQMSKLTHLILFPILAHSNGTLYFRYKEKEKRFKTIVSKAKQLPGLKVMVSNYGGNFDNKNVSQVWAIGSILKSGLIASIISFVNLHSLDGVDFTFKKFHFPKTESDFANLNTFFKDLRENVTVRSENADPFIISTVLSPYASENAHINLKYFDFLTIETNNYYGSWHLDNSHLVGPSSALYSNQAKLTFRYVDHSMRSYSCLSKQPNKLNILVDFHGRYWENVIPPENLSDTLSMTAEAINGSVRGTWLKRQNFLKNGWDVTKALWNDDSKTPFIWKAEKRKYFTFENVRSLEEKIGYAVEKNIGGLAIWLMENDDDSNKLLDVLASAAFCSGNNTTDVKYDCCKDMYSCFEGA